jgi:hypothetical protein
MFGCPANQVFYIHEILVGWDAGQQVGNWRLMLESWPNKNYNYSNHPPNTLMYDQIGPTPRMFVLGAGVPVQRIQITKADGPWTWGRIPPSFNMIVWGSCGVPTPAPTYYWGGIPDGVP